MMTKKKITYKAIPYGTVGIIPKGTPVTLATNLPYLAYWIEPWEGMTEKEKSWQRNYGFMAMQSEVKNEI